MKKSLALAGAALAATLLAPHPARAANGLPDIDPTVTPCQNFYQYACGSWMRANPIPSDQSRWGTFNKLNLDNQTILKTALEKVVANPAADSKRIADFYASCMDEAAADAKGAAPIKSYLDKIAALADKKDLPKLVAELHDAGANVFFGYGSQTDFQDARQNIAAVAQAGLGLPNRDFYTRESEKDENRRKAYVAHMEKMFGLIGEPAEAASARARTVMRIETALAKASLTLAQQNDPKLTNHKLPAADLGKYAPSFQWPAYLTAVNSPALVTLNIAEPDFLKAFDHELTTASIEDVKAYLAWHVVHAYAPWLSRPFVDENFAFYGKTLSGAEELKPRWKRCVQETDIALGEDLGRYFVEAAFGAEQKSRMLTMVADLKQAMDADIDTLLWMGTKTRKQAHIKLAAIIDKIGYPDKWRDYSKLEIVAGDLAGNVARANTFENQRDMAKIGKPHDKGEWEMTPPTVNAYYEPTENDINFPAGILQPPFFQASADDAVNYGAIGAVIGHEITHGFDDQGRQYDKDGNLKDWWTREDAKKFTTRAKCVADQYSSYVAVDDLHENGEASLGENLADNGGIRIALDAYRKRLAGKGETVGGFTPDQRFFLGFAQVWCGNAKDDAKRTQVMADVHSLPQSRVNGTVSNNEAFAKAFNCKADDPMVRGPKACRVW